MKLFIDIVMKRIYLFNIVAWNYRKKIGFPICKKENFAGLQAHRKRGKSARASPTPHHTWNEERSARFTAQHLSALLSTRADKCCKVFSPFFSLKQSKVNSKNWEETNFEVSKKQKDVWDVFFKIKKKDDGDWNWHNLTLHELHAFIKYASSSYETHDLLSFSFSMDDIFLRVLDSN